MKYAFLLFFLFFLSLGGGGSTNLVGKFTQSVRRIVQDVKDEGVASKFHLFSFFFF